METVLLLSEDEDRGEGEGVLGIGRREGKA